MTDHPLKSEQHPLTDEMILSIADEAYHLPGYQDDMRAAYDKGRDDQLEQVIEWLKMGLPSGCYLEHSTWEKSEIDVDYLLHDLKKAMRPQVVDLPQANSDVCGEEGIERARQRTLEENAELMRLLSDS
jgi:hypothetical protein